MASMQAVLLLTSALLVVFLTFRRVFSILLRSIYQSNFGIYRAIPALPQNPIVTYTIGDPWQGLLAGLRGSSAAEYVEKYIYCERTLGKIFLVRRMFGSPAVRLMDPRVIKHVLITVPYAAEKHQLLKVVFGPILGPTGLVLTEGDTHRRLRRTVLPAFHHKTLLSFAPVFLDEAHRVATVFKNACLASPSRPLTLPQNVAFTACSVILRSFFRESVISDARRDQLCSAFMQLFRDSRGMAVDFLIAIFQGNLSSTGSKKNTPNSLDRLLGKFSLTSIIDKRSPHRAVIRNTADQLLKLSTDSHGQGAVRDSVPVDRQAMIDIILENDRLETQRLTGVQIYDTLLTMVAAGQVTTAMTIAWALYRMGRHPEWQQRVQHEIDGCSIWKDKTNDPQIRMVALDELPLLQRVVKEVLRLHPPLFEAFTRNMTVPIQVDEVTLPAGCSFVIPIYAMHMNPRYWENPAIFDPDRFLPEAEAVREPMAWIPFLYGPRGCIGQRFALLEIKCVLAAVLDELQLSVDPSEPPATMAAGMSRYPKSGLFASVRN